MSSRNAYLSAEDRQRALGLSRGLRAASKLFGEGERDARTLERACLQEVEKIATSIDYVTVADPDTITPISGNTGARALLAIACRVGTTRLIDNMVLGEDTLPS